MTEEERIKHIKLILNTLPEQPGVYQHLDEGGKVIYVGKAKNLKRRVSNYFRPNKDSFKTAQLSKHIYDIRYIIVENEQDALLLENNLIKQYQPHYNILLKDGKSYPSIAITKEEYPRVYKTRNIDRRIAEYYGPYPFGNTLELILELIHELYPIRTCKQYITQQTIDAGKHKVCLKYHIGKCCGICEGKTSKAEYDNYIAEIRSIIKGNAKSIYDDTLKKMRQYAADLEFEKAETEKRKLILIERFISKTIISNTKITDTLVVASHQDERKTYISYIFIINGSIVKAKNLVYQRNKEETEEEILERATDEILDNESIEPQEIIAPTQISISHDNIKTVVPQKGQKKELLDLALKNAIEQKENSIKQEIKLNPDQRNIRILEQLQQKLHLNELPKLIESFDNSNIQGTAAVAACVVFEMGKPAKDQYRKFDIKTVEGQDDYASMREIIYRRYSRQLEEHHPLPQLIIADGGVGQMNAIRDALHSGLNIDIPIAGLVKDNKHRTAALLYGFPPVEIGLKPTDELFHFLTRIQDEVHRFAITFHKNKRSRAQTKSELDDIKGIGEKTKQSLLREFKSVRRIKSAELQQLEKIIGKSKASIVYEALHEEITPRE